MRVDRAVRLVSRAWRGQRGYVFLPWIDGDAEVRRKGWHEGRAFKWPEDRDRIVAHARAHVDDDLYFTPLVYSGKHRALELVRPERAVFADLDEVNPSTLDDELRPTIAWATSPGRYQGLWLLTDETPGSARGGGLGHRLTHAVGADAGGWDATQVLRLPGWRNHKPDRGGVRGELLWSDGPVHDPATLDAHLPPVPGPEAVDVDLADEVLRGVDKRQVWRRIKMKVPARTRRLLRASDDGGADRSEMLWSIERDLADAGCTVVEITALVRDTVWNKYADRTDELKRLAVVAHRAVAQARGADEDEGETTQDAEETGLSLVDVAGLARRVGGRRRWLVQDLWPAGGVGFFAGAPKSFKSYLALDMAVAVAADLPFLGRRVVLPGPVIYVQVEDPDEIVWERVEAIVAEKDPGLHPLGPMKHEPGVGVTWAPPDRTLPLHMSIRQAFDASEDGDQEWLLDQVRETGARLVVLDTLVAASVGVDFDKPEIMQRSLTPLRDLSTATGCAVLVVHHTRKAKEGRSGLNMLGSVTIHAWAEQSLFFERTGDDRLHVEVESKRSAVGRLDLALCFDDGAFRAEIVEPEDAERSGAEVEETGSPVVDELKRRGPGGATVAGLARAVNLSERRVRSELQEAESAGAAERRGARWRTT